jgi:ribosome-binding protein aMBF1 (putative translation factor)
MSLEQRVSRPIATAMITGDQIKTARLILGWSTETLAAEARLSRSTIRVCERGDTKQSAWVLDSIREALESAGVEFAEGQPPRCKVPPHS